jgi:hypothetical protein
MMVTFGAFTVTVPLMSRASMTVPAVLIVIDPDALRAVPAGTPVLDASGHPVCGAGAVVVVVGGFVVVVVGGFVVVVVGAAVVTVVGGAVVAVVDGAVVGAVMVGAVALAGTISTAATFQRSLVGADVPIVTRVPAFGIIAVRWLQNVSPTEVSTNWFAMVWPLRSVRDLALSQSLPAAHTHDPATEVVSVVAAAPIEADPLAFTPMFGAAPVNDATEIAPCHDPLARVALTTAFVTVDDAYAVQTSAAPACALARDAKRQVSPAPETEAMLWEPGTGPSVDTKATSSSFGPAVENVGVEMVDDDDDEFLLTTWSSPKVAVAPTVELVVERTAPPKAVTSVVAAMARTTTPRRGPAGRIGTRVVKGRFTGRGSPRVGIHSALACTHVVWCTATERDIQSIGGNRLPLNDLTKSTVARAGASTEVAMFGTLLPKRVAGRPSK